TVCPVSVQPDGTSGDWGVIRAWIRRSGVLGVTAGSTTSRVRPGATWLGWDSGTRLRTRRPQPPLDGIDNGVRPHMPFTLALMRCAGAVAAIALPLVRPLQLQL